MWPSDWVLANGRWAEVASSASNRHIFPLLTVWNAIAGAGVGAIPVCPEKGNTVGMAEQQNEGAWVPDTSSPLCQAWNVREKGNAILFKPCILGSLLTAAYPVSIWNNLWTTQFSSLEVTNENILLGPSRDISCTDEQIPRYVHECIHMYLHAHTDSPLSIFT